MCRRIVLVLCLFILGSSLEASQPQLPTDAPAGSDTGTAPTAFQPSVNKRAPSAYTLSPHRAAQAVAYARASHQLYFLNLAYSVAVLLLLLRFRVAPRFRDWAEGASQSRFLQALVFVPGFALTFDVLTLPLDMAGHWMQRHFGQSIQGWGSWLWDQTLADMVSIASVVFLVWLLYLAIRRSARHWWFYGWLAALPVILFTGFVNPLLIDPLFSQFTPLAASQPELTKQIERVVVRSGQQIPESRIFLMDASRKVDQVNAYVTGLGGSERVVVWDTIVSRMTTPQILFVFGHEMGHYVLRHSLQQMMFAAGLLLVVLWAASYVFRWAVDRYGDAWALRGVDDWASLPVLFLLLSLFGFVCTPAIAAFNRHLEHQADQYGLEVVHGLIPDVSGVAAESFRILGELDLEEPSPSWLVKIWFYTHPPIAERIRFAYDYDPWAKGQSPRFVK